MVIRRWKQAYKYTYWNVLISIIPGLNEQLQTWMIIPWERDTLTTKSNIVEYVSVFGIN